MNKSNPDILECIREIRNGYEEALHQECEEKVLYKYLYEAMLATDYRLRIEPNLDREYQFEECVLSYITNLPNDYTNKKVIQILYDQIEDIRSLIVNHYDCDFMMDKKDVQKVVNLFELIGHDYSDVLKE